MEFHNNTRALIAHSTHSQILYPVTHDLIYREHTFMYPRVGDKITISETTVQKVN